MLKRDLEAGAEARANPLKRVGRPGFEGAKTPTGGGGRMKGRSSGLGRSWNPLGLYSREVKKKKKKRVPKTGAWA